MGNPLQSGAAGSETPTCCVGSRIGSSGSRLPPCLPATSRRSKRRCRVWREIKRQAEDLPKEKAAVDEALSSKDKKGTIYTNNLFKALATNTYGKDGWA